MIAYSLAVVLKCSVDPVGLHRLLEKFQVGNPGIAIIFLIMAERVLILRDIVGFMPGTQG